MAPSLDIWSVKREYKQHTSSLVKYIVREAEIQGTLRPFLTALHSPIPKTDGDSLSVAHSLPTLELLNLTTLVTSTPPRDIDAWRTVASKAKKSIKGRCIVASYLAEKADVEHQHFIDVLIQMCSEIDRMLALSSREAKPDRVQSNPPRKLHCSTSNAYAVLDSGATETTGHLTDSDEHRVIESALGQPRQSQRSESQRNLENDLVELRRHLTALNAMRAFLKEVWMQQLAGVYSFYEACLCTSVAFALAECADNAYTLCNPDVSTYTQVRGMLSRHHPTAHAEDSREPVDNASDRRRPSLDSACADWLCCDGYISILTASGKAYSGYEGCSRSHLAVFAAILQARSGAHSPERARPAVHYNNFLSGVKESFTSGVQTVWTVWCCQVYLDILERVGVATWNAGVVILERRLRDSAQRAFAILSTAADLMPVADRSSRIHFAEALKAAKEMACEALELLGTGLAPTETPDPQEPTRQAGYSIALPVCAASRLYTVQAMLCKESIWLTNETTTVASLAYLYAAFGPEEREKAWSEMETILPWFADSAHLLQAPRSMANTKRISGHFYRINSISPSAPASPLRRRSPQPRGNPVELRSALAVALVGRGASAPSRACKSVQRALTTIAGASRGDVDRTKRLVDANSVLRAEPDAVDLLEVSLETFRADSGIMDFKFETLCRSCSIRMAGIWSVLKETDERFVEMSLHGWGSTMLALLLLRFANVGGAKVIAIRACVENWLTGRVTRGRIRPGNGDGSG